jgi:23S rRNA pseudouridine1911/1915/1917 synthase
MRRISSSQHSTLSLLLVLHAKPPPISNFDLDAIEAFEDQMDNNAQQQQQDQDDTIFIMDGVDEDGDDLFDGDGIEDDEVNGETQAQTFTVPDHLHGMRIDAVLAAMLQPSLSRSVCGNLVVEGRVRQQQQVSENDNSILLLNRKSLKVDAGTVLRVEIPNPSRPDRIVAQNLPLSILFEDQHMIVLNKAAGMVVHPGAGNWQGTVVNALAYYLAYNSTRGAGDFVVRPNGTVPDDDIINDNDETIIMTTTATSSGDPVVDGEKSTVSFRPGIVHRLDKGTTGILVVAKTTRALTRLSEAFADRDVKKTYLAITVGNPGKNVVIDKPIGRHPIHRQRMRVVPDPHCKDSSGTTPEQRRKLKSMQALSAASSSSSSSSLSQSGRRALSYVDTLAFDGKLSLAKVRIETGRTHQIRVHLQDRHTPIYGDDVYGIADWNQRLMKSHGIERPLLHAYRLELQHPITGEEMVLEAPMADDMIGIARTIWPEGPEELPAAFS